MQEEVSMRIAICEDNQKHADILKGMIHKWADAEGIEAYIGHYESAEQFMFCWENDIPYDLVYLKIEDVSKRYIWIEITYREGNLLIHFSNAAKEDAKRIGGIWQTTKAQAAVHGFGLKSINRVVSQYQGYCRRELKNNVFTCLIRMPDIRIGG